MDRFVDLVRQLEPETAPPPLEAQARQRDFLLRSMAPAQRARRRPPRRRPGPKGWFAVVVAAAAAAVVVATLVPRSSPPPRQPAHTSAVLLAVTRALATTGDDIEEVHSAVPGTPLSVTSWVDLSTGACRTDTSLNGQPSLRIFVEHGSAVIIDYGLRQWWTRDAEGVTCEPLTPQTIEHAVAAGRYVVSGRVTLDGQESLKLVATATTSGLHAVTKLDTLWVNATTYLPIQSTSTGHLTETTKFTWLPATATNKAVLNITVPVGFHQVAPPPAGTLPGG